MATDHGLGTNVPEVSSELCVLRSNFALSLNISSCSTLSASPHLESGGDRDGETSRRSRALLCESHAAEGEPILTSSLSSWQLPFLLEMREHPSDVTFEHAGSGQPWFTPQCHRVPTPEA